ncbi:MAG: UMP kinase [Armatimonadetes bacterium]|nr:UMP kinase [Armatimonadota bacterium]
MPDASFPTTERDVTAAGSGPRWGRALLKLSGEALAGGRGFGFDTDSIARLAREIADALATGVQLAVVVGGGNVLRGHVAAEAGMQRVAADHIGMLATVQNGIAMQDALEKLGVPTRVQTAVTMVEFAEPFIRRRAISHLEAGRVVILAGGTGNPFFSTDTAAALRALEIGADAVLKATNVDGVYDKDPHANADATRYESVTYKECIERRLGVMDVAAFALCEEHNLPIVVFDVNQPGSVKAAVLDQGIGTVVRR